VTKLLAAYTAAPTLNAAIKVRNYSLKHPMTACLLTFEQQEVLAAAIRHINAMKEASPTRKINYKPRLTDAEAYERLPVTLQRCLQEAVTSFSSYAVLKYFNKNGLSDTISWIHAGDFAFMKKGHVMGRGKHKKIVQSTFVACKVTPLRTYGIKPTTRIGRQA